jgi:hypothetical protein
MQKKIKLASLAAGFAAIIQLLGVNCLTIVGFFS